MQSTAQKMITERAVYDDISLHIKQQKEKQNVCKSCKSPFDEDSISDGFLVCKGCGLVKSAYIDTQAEWRCFSSTNGTKDLSGVRCGETASSLTPGTQLNTFISGKDRRLQRIHQWNNVSPKERNLHQIYKEFEHISQEHNLPKCIILCATELYSKLYTEMENRNCGVKRCNVRQGLKAACLYFACKQSNTPRERKEIAEMVGNTTKIVTKGCNSFLDIMGSAYIELEPFKPQDFVERFSLAVGLPYNYQLKLKKLVEFVECLEPVADNTPTSVTSACLYLLSKYYNLGITKNDIHEKCGSSSIIVSRTYDKIIPFEKDICVMLDQL